MGEEAVDGVRGFNTAALLHVLLLLYCSHLYPAMPRERCDYPASSVSDIFTGLLNPHLLTLQRSFAARHAKQPTEGVNITNGLCRYPLCPNCRWLVDRFCNEATLFCQEDKPSDHVARWRFGARVNAAASIHDQTRHTANRSKWSWPAVGSR